MPPVASATTTSCPASAAASEAQNAPGYYPPELAGMRGDHSGLFATAHKLRDGDFWSHCAPARDTGETYDLAIVGAGLSGLATAHFYLQQEPSALCSCCGLPSTRFGFLIACATAKTAPTGR